jgi:CheY-like chemotaxis protein
MHDTFDQFKNELHSALLHLHSADYQFPAQLCMVLGCDNEEINSVQSRLIQWVRTLAPAQNISQESRTKQLYDVLHQRFVLGLTQEESAHNLYMSTRTLQRIQRNAIHLLARRIWDFYQSHAVPDRNNNPQNLTPDTWETQVQQELDSLQQNITEATCDLQTAIRGVLRIAAESEYRPSVSLIVEGVPENCNVKLHPSVTEQVILMALMALEQVINSGEIAIEVVVTGAYAKVVLRGSPVPDGVELNLAFAQELLAAQSGELILNSTANELKVTLHLPRTQRSSGRYTVLVVDDNADLVTLYATYCIDTAFDVIHVRHGNYLFERVAEMHPDVIFLDVLLPDVNGWQLLMDLQNTPETRHIPVVVCSIITDEQMALNLGAVLYLKKPVWRQSFLNALNQVLMLPQS